ncbi:MAG: thiamine phosphate synthase [Chloroflexi bacterium]|nr:thiamine phosphate synthase [Chloroflexota bacterium]
MATLPQPCLALVTDRWLCREQPLQEKVSLALAGGVDMVQLREKELPAGALLALAEGLRAITAGRALFMVNDRVDVALACGADGVQLGEEGLPVAAARHLGGPGLLFGRSVHSVEGAVRAEAEGADFLVLGAIFRTSSHPGAPTAGVGLIRQVRQRVRLPLLGIGGITEGNVGQVMEAGADGAAVISALLGAPDPAEAARALKAAMLAALRRMGEVQARR